MKALDIQSTSHSPQISFDPGSKKFEIKGESRPENASNFYKPILEWVKDIETAFENNEIQVDGPLEFDFCFDYFNSTSAKFILDFCKKLGQVHSKGLEMKVRWIYEEDDEDMLEVGEEMARMAKMPFEYVEVK